jgi:hypothetical protein
LAIQISSALSPLCRPSAKISGTAAILPAAGSGVSGMREFSFPA